MSADWSDHKARRPVPVAGLEIHTSRVKTVVKVVILIACSIGGATLIVLSLYNAHFRPPGTRSSLTEGQFTLLVVFAVATAVFAVVAVEALRAGRRLVIGWDRVQLLEGRGVSTVVKAQIPFANLKRIDSVSGGLGSCLEITLRDPDDPHTWLPETDPERHFRTHGYHYRLTGTFTRSKPEILDAILDAEDEWLGSCEED